MKSNSLLNLFTSTLVLFLVPSFAAGQSFQRTIYNSGGNQDIVVTDLNQGGKPDLLTVQPLADPEEGGAVLFLNGGDGTFTFTVPQFAIAPTRIVVADFNGGGIPVLATQSCTSGGATLVTYTRDPVSGALTPFAFADADFPNPPFVTSCIDAMAAITISHDSLPSVVLATDDTRLTIFRNDGTGHFPQQQSVSGAPGMRLAGISVGDFNGDHLQDIAAVSVDPNGGPQQVVIFLQNPDGSFQSPVTVFSLNATLQFTQAVDFNGNESDDLVVPFFGGPDKRAGVVALTNVGRGKFRSKILLADPFYISAGQKAAAIHSTQKNGIRGILAPFSPAPSTGDSVFAFFPEQGNTWGRPIYFDVPNGKGAQAVVTADFNGDGRPDFAGVDSNNELLVFLNTSTQDTLWLSQSCRSAHLLTRLRQGFR